MAKKSAVSEYLSKIGRKGGSARGTKGFAAMTPEQREAARLKGLETRRKNAAKKKRIE